jgi:hypothetical protein
MNECRSELSTGGAQFIGISYFLCDKLQMENDHFLYVLTSIDAPSVATVTVP